MHSSGELLSGPRAIIETPAEVRAAAWWTGYGSAERPARALSDDVQQLVASIRKLPAHDQVWALAPLRDAFHLLSDDAAASIVDAWVDLAHTESAERENAAAALERLYWLASAKLKVRIVGTGLVRQPQLAQLTPSTSLGREIALVVPRFLSGKSFLQPPLDMLLAATALRAKGFTVSLFDLRAQPTTDDLLAERLANVALVVICTTPYDQVQTYYVDYRLADALRLIKTLVRRTTAKVIVTGSHGSISPSLMLKATECAYVIRGEVEDALVDIALCELEGSRLSNQDVFYSGRAAPAIVVGEFNRFGRSENLERMPSYDLVDFSNYFGDGYKDGLPFHKKRAGAVLATRGCPFKCEFCFNYWGTRTRKRSVDSVIDELELLQRRWNVSTVFFIDFTFTIDRTWVLSFCEAYVRSGLSISWSCETRPDLVDEVMLRAMRKAGCTEVWLGAESFNAAVMRDSGKGFSVRETMDAIERIRRAGLGAHTFIVLGLPGETVASLNETIQTLWRVRTPYTQSVIIATPRMGTAYFERAKRCFPDRDLESSYFAVSPIKGLVDNEMTPYMLQEAVALLADRSRVFAGASAPMLSIA